MLDSDFSRQVRAHDFMEKILSVLQDALDDQVKGQEVGVAVGGVSTGEECLKLMTCFKG